MAAAHRRHDMTDEVWERLRPHLPVGEGKRGRPSRDSRGFIDAVCWILRTGAPWRDLPRTTGTGRIPIAASAAGGTGACGPGCWRK